MIEKDMPFEPLITIFNGRRRRLGGEDSPNEVFVQFFSPMVKYLHLFTSAEWLTLSTIAFHINEDGWACPGIPCLVRESGLGTNTVKRALAGLVKKHIEGRRVLLRWQPRKGQGLIKLKGKGGKGRFGPNHYLIFPSKAEIARFEGSGVQHPRAQRVAASKKGFPSPQKGTTGKGATKKRTTKRRSSENGARNHNHHEPEHVDVDDELVTALESIGFQPRHEVERYAQAHPAERVLGWVAAVKRPEYSWVKFPPRYVRKMLDQGISPPVLFEEKYLESGDEVEVILPEKDELSPLDEMWKDVLADLRGQMTSDTFNTWLKPTRVLERENGMVCVGVGTDYVKEWLENRLQDTVERALARVAGEELEVKFVSLDRKGPDGQK